MSNSNSTPPFNIGDQIVARRDQKEGDFKKGEDFKCKEMSQCRKCKTWFVDIGRYEKLEGGFDAFDDQCSECDYSELVFEKSIPIWYRADLFAPIDQYYAGIIAEIIEKYPLTEGGQVDRVVIPQTVNN
jgi:hypothetical protein